MKENRKLTQKEKLFCHFYVKTSNIKESAINSGFRIFPEKTGLKLLEDELILKEIERLFKAEKEKFNINKIIAGYMRIAFGSVTDAVKLMFLSEEELLDVESLDLFNISEIKRQKGGGIEIKFFDRTKALESLLKCNIEQTSSENSFFDAFNSGLENLSKMDKEKLGE